MLLLTIGVLLWAVAHLFPAIGVQPRERMVARLGAAPARSRGRGLPIYDYSGVVVSCTPRVVLIGPWPGPIAAMMRHNEFRHKRPVIIVSSQSRN